MERTRFVASDPAAVHRRFLRVKARALRRVAAEQARLARQARAEAASRRRAELRRAA